MILQPDIRLRALGNAGAAGPQPVLDVNTAGLLDNRRNDSGMILSPMRVDKTSSSRGANRSEEALTQRGHPAGCENLLNQITQSELQDLAAYARFRLNRAGLHPGVAEDVRQSALLAVLMGSTTELGGRHPREADLGDRSAFSRYLKGVIRSLVEARCRGRDSRFISTTIDANMLAAQGPDASEHLALEDLARQLFSRLRERVPGPLRPIVGDWASRWKESDVIPLGGRHRRHRKELRSLAAKILGEVAMCCPRNARPRDPQTNQNS